MNVSFSKIELTGLAKAMLDAKQGGALTEEESNNLKQNSNNEEKKEDSKTDEENKGEEKESGTSLRSDSKMIPNVPNQPNMASTLGSTGSTIAAAGTGMNAASLMLRSEANQKEVDELHKRLAVLTEDISHKQTLIDRLLKEVDKRSDAIRTCGVEIVQLRR